MTASRLVVASLAVAFLLIAVPNSAFAQAAGGGRQRGANGAAADPAQARERALTRIKEQLGASDDEWKVLSPKVDKVLTAQQDARAGGGRGGQAAGGRGARGNRGGQAQAQTPDPATLSAVAKATAELRAAVADKATPPEELTRKLNALHEAKEKAKAARLEAQKDLKELLTARQEALLVQSGLLE
jgi:hypothetical protein